MERNKITFTTTFDDAKFSVTEREGGKMPLMSGYAMVWGALSDDRGGYKVRLMPNSATPFSAGPVLALCNHDYSQVLASSANGTLALEPDAYGLKVTIDPADTSYARDMCNLIRHLKTDGKSKVGMSFGLLGCNAQFTESQEEDEDGEEMTIRNYSHFEFDEVTVTPIPAFQETTIDTEFAKAHTPAETPLRNRLAVDIAAAKMGTLAI